MVVKKDKRLDSSETTRRHKEKRKAAGLREIKIFVHPDDATRVRDYAKKQPATKAALKSLND